MRSYPKTTEESIIDLLQKGSSRTTFLLEKLQSGKGAISKQAFYKTLRKLIEDEVVVVRSKVASLSHVWILKMSQFFENAKRSYSIETQGEDFLLLNDGERVSYTFKTPEQTDMFWGHAFSVLVDTMKEKTVFLYNPHEWFLLARYHTERTLFDDLLKRNKTLLVLSGHNTVLDKFIQKDFDGVNSQHFALEHMPFEKENYHFNIFGDFIIEARLDEKVAKEIHSFYTTTKVFTKDAERRIKAIVSKKGKNKLTISRNKKKAEHLRKLFEKYFLVK